jgi:hypothetical protein
MNTCVNHAMEIEPRKTHMAYFEQNNAKIIIT